ncbi:MAG: precorrin-3B C(17)-methyltransferase [Euryarchaeota archaeon]|nr:precorrin-3B C(17)-methyltransferase [Euryarchaeota archaeon]MBV1728779.1 precorrin-3B C(17)-methyltransferase [Methanobacterium sp.]MBU4548082.1 precorrin-3B C(17)-methyltransferase [Euryarchaeota archaeon]MBU4607416.1 precorrin-3B C(17)-methyltransferase [Euryarchaeota archaeon]MBV1756114.1 precorrin-3B C(17)-methyltransferase [Methanobacterium sp.]
MISIVGIGPTREDITLRALEAIKKAEVVIGYKRYVNSVNDLLDGKEIIKKGMGDEIVRAEMAIQKSLEGKKVAIISSGDPGVFGMGNVFFQLVGKYSGIEVEVIPGVTAANYAASLLGAPLHDFAVISLSDILTPLSEIKNKIEHAVKGGLIIAFYNPRSKTRIEPFKLAQKILQEHLNPETPVGIVQSTSSGPKINIINLKDLEEDMINMSTVLIVGNSTTYVEEGFMITPRGYVVSGPIHPLSQEFYQKFIKGEQITGPNTSCEYYPCHTHPQNCTFCYCPFYPCGDGSTGGRWIKDKGVWSCQGCEWIHQNSTVDCIMEKIPYILEKTEDLKKKKKDLLKLRRECIIGR